MGRQRIRRSLGELETIRKRISGLSAGQLNALIHDIIHDVTIFSSNGMMTKEDCGVYREIFEEALQTYEGILIRRGFYEEEARAQVEIFRNQFPIGAFVRREG